MSPFVTIYCLKPVWYGNTASFRPQAILPWDSTKSSAHFIRAKWLNLDDCLAMRFRPYSPVLIISTLENKYFAP